MNPAKHRRDQRLIIREDDMLAIGVIHPRKLKPCVVLDVPARCEVILPAIQATPQQMVVGLGDQAVKPRQQRSDTSDEEEDIFDPECTILRHWRQR